MLMKASSRPAILVAFDRRENSLNIVASIVSGADAIIREGEIGQTAA
ncbi:hypothetical protein BIWAKO_06447 [Bosea sp. BIWAKO-01]|nr:hypothetical protein BIWAKO_06447 [Bosea sp. BIWAKO-01]